MAAVVRFLALLLLLYSSGAFSQTVEDLLKVVNEVKYETAEVYPGYSFLVDSFYDSKVNFSKNEQVYHDSLKDYVFFATRGKFYENGAYLNALKSVEKGSLVVGGSFVPYYVYYATLLSVDPLFYDEGVYNALVSESSSLSYRFYAYQALKSKGEAAFVAAVRRNAAQLEYFVKAVRELFPDPTFTYSKRFASDKGDALFHKCVIISAGVCCGPHTCHYCFCRCVNVFDTPLSYGPVKEALMKSFAYKIYYLHGREAVLRRQVEVGSYAAILESFDSILEQGRALFR